MIASIMKSKKNTYIFAIVALVVVIAALLLIFGLPKAAAACSTSSCGGYPQTPNYPQLRYVYYQDPARAYRESENYVPVVYPIPRYVQTGINANGTTNYAYTAQPNSMGLSYVPYGTTPTAGTPVYGNYSNPYSYNNYGNSYNSGYGYNTGFTTGMNGGSSASTQYGASAGGFINTSGR